MTIAEKHIQHFNKMQGNYVRKATLQKFHDQVRAANLPELKELEQKLSRAISKINGGVVRLSFKPIKLSKPVPSQKTEKESKREPVTKPVKAEKAKSAKNAPVKKLSGIVTADQIAGLEFKEIPITGKWKQQFGRLMSDTKIMTWGLPGSRKTINALLFAQYLAQEMGMNVLFIANEEMNRSTLTEKIRDLKIGHPKLKFVRNFRELEIAGVSITDFEVVLLDSVQSLGMSLQDYKDFAEQYPNMIHYLILQTIKDGDFRGGKDWEHEVDIAGEMVNQKMILRKNRLDKDHYKKSDKLRIQEIIRQKERDAMIKQSVKAKVKQKKQLQPVQHDKAK